MTFLFITQEKKLKKLPKLKHYKRKKSTDTAPTATPADGATGASAPQSDNAISDSNKTEQAMNQFRNENSGTGNGMWEFLGM